MGEGVNHIVKRGEVQIVQAVQSLCSVQIVGNNGSSRSNCSRCSNGFENPTGSGRFGERTGGTLGSVGFIDNLLRIRAQSRLIGRLICNQVRFPETAFNADSRSMRCDELGYEYGVPSLRTNRPSALELIMSMSEQVVRSFGLREPTSR